MTRARAALALVAVAAVATAAVACGGSAQPPDGRESDRFDAAAAYRLIEEQVSYGQRPAGSPQLRELARRLRGLLPAGRFAQIPGSPRLRNVVGSIPGSLPATVIGAHYDTLADPKGFVGANNGAAGTAIVVQLARTLAEQERPPGSPELRFVLFDGEEPRRGLPEESENFYRDGLRGSRAYARAERDEIGSMILLDYVANEGLQLPREASSDPQLWEAIREAATAVGAARQFPDGMGPTIVDDHTPFLRAGIPAVDLIDWSYPGHSLEDGLDRLSLTSIDAVGETLVEYLDSR